MLIQRLGRVLASLLALGLWLGICYARSVANFAIGMGDHSIFSEIGWMLGYLAYGVVTILIIGALISWIKR